MLLASILVILIPAQLALSVSAWALHDTLYLEILIDLKM